MVSSFDTNPRDIWKTIGCTGVADNRNQKTPFEDYNEEGSLNTDPKSVLQKWKHDFEKMYNIQASCGNDQESNLQSLGNIYLNAKETQPFSIHFFLPHGSHEANFLIISCVPVH